MSKLRQPNGDDHPEAAGKHLDDASTLDRSGRPDGASYLAGYVVECSLKAVICLEAVGRGIAPSKWWGGGGHDWRKLAAELSTASAVAGPRTARYVTPIVSSLSSAAIAAWTPGMRYRAPSMTGPDAAKWLSEARLVYQATVGQMLLDGVL
jgi:hypothetical protein